ncbi:MAG TPA: ABC transporter ATP-binding protein [Gemmatimonadaceae bacterium]|jgi:peptide/nickel transport system ATP-binding protein|nr:ABC transporter ATP-binding protein [Gemmatimonadaceae bacterium]
MTTPLLSVRDLRTVFDTDAGLARAVDGVSFDVATGESVGLVGESGCGKSVTAFSILRLIRPPGRIVEGSQITLDGTDLMSLDAESLRQIRGSRVSMVFQEPMTALNPVLRIGDQIAEVLRVHDHTPGKEARERSIEMLRLVGLSDPAARFDQYPHQLSGGMRQRVVIAMALVMHPELILADEPTTALDVTVQAQILELLAELRERMGMAMVLITHDLGVIAESTSRVMVMYAGEIVEEALVGELFDAPHHPYTNGLLRAIPEPTPADRGRRLAVIPGSVPPATDWPSGCRFRTRCAYAWERCEHEHPPVYQIGAGHTSRCHLAEEPWRRS